MFISDCISKAGTCLVCILFCVLNETNGTEALVCARTAVTDNSSKEHSGWFQKQHISASDRLLFNTNKQNEYSATQLEMYHLLQVYLYHKMLQKLIFRWRRIRIYWGISDLTAFTGRRKCTYPIHIGFISTYEWGLKPIEDYRNPCDLFLLTRSWARSDLCHMGGKIGIGSLELCRVNAALDLYVYSMCMYYLYIGLCWKSRMS